MYILIYSLVGFGIWYYNFLMSVVEDTKPPFWLTLLCGPIATLAHVIFFLGRFVSRFNKK